MRMRHSHCRCHDRFAIVSKHCPTQNRERVFCMTRSFQTGARDRQSFEPGSRHRPCSEQGQLWFRHEGKTRVVDLGWTAGEMGERIRTATGLTRKKEVYVTIQGRRETWEGVAAMEDGGGAKREWCHVARDYETEAEVLFRACFALQTKCDVDIRKNSYANVVPDQ